MKQVILLFLCIGIFLITGCWDRQEANETTIVTGMAIDKGDKEKYKLTVEIVNPPALNPKIGGESTASIVYSLEGKSIAELAEKMNIGYTRNLRYSHMQVVVVSKEVAKDELLEFLDYMERNREIRNDFHLIVSEGPAEEILKVIYHIQRISGLKLRAQLKTMFKQWGGDPDIRLNDMIDSFISPGMEPSAPIVRVQGDPELGKKKANKQQVEPAAMVVLDGLSVFKDFKYQGALAIRDARNVLWLRDMLQQTSLSFNCSTDLSATVRVNNSRTRIKATYQNNVPTFVVDVEFEARIDSAECPDDLTKATVYRIYEEKAARAVEAELSSTITQLQKKFQSDIVGLGQHMERQQYKKFKEVKDSWNEEFARADVQVNVQAHLRRSGLTKESFLKKMAE